ncbi:SRPBCC family protein [Aeromicrobium chenweiae]|uniref:Cyclase n=1 Tax=Aeromicrobium chenweiae TaxID=2079793 RepID=A0A2S0WKS1_9ACTN|nr:SRPBCC family protein [Aeromicrobium chenweiae]AWB91921.1 cyclase [Aeromicrobium chenweiae]TGN32772.1 SRPBCC family protein [Aeromicrobium chenweiae]
MGALVESVQVAVPLRTAYDQWTQFETFPRFMSVVKEVHQERPAITRWTLRYGPLRHEFHAETLEQHPDSRVEWRSLDRRFRHEGLVAFDALEPARTAVRVEVRFETPWHSDTVLLPVVQRLLRSELEHFKTFIEGMGEAGEAWRGTIHGGRVQHTYDSSPSVPGWPHG